ncbi:hypothetical protein [Streptomyces sp. NPDC001985]|uniref:hypothetical protein n=1 Tax=Streptomyces sp. NPDC001985 TaxID=3154406 RepID=UPI003325D30C
MARRQPNLLLAELLHEADWGPAQLARSVNAVGAAQGMRLAYDRTSVAHWLTGSRPNPPIPDLVASALSARSGRLVTAVDTGLVRHRQPAGDALPRQGEGDAVERLTALCRADSEPLKRARLARTAYSVGAAGASPVWRPKRHVSVRAGDTGRRVTPADVHRLHGMTKVFSDLMAVHGGAHARTALTAYLADDTSRLLAGPAAPALRPGLFTGAGQLTHLLARMSMDAGAPGLAQRYFTSALDLAREADDRRLYAITLRAMSVQALDLGFGGQARRLAETAVDTTGPVTDPYTASFLLGQRAAVHACARDRHRAVADLSTAEARYDRASSQAGPFAGYPRPGFDYQRGQVLLALGETDRAAQALAAAVEGRAADRHRPLALVRARLAETLLPLGRLEESCLHWHAFLDHYPSLESNPADQALRQMRLSLRGYRRQPDAVAVLQRARAFTGTRAAP